VAGLSRTAPITSLTPLKRSELANPETVRFRNGYEEAAMYIGIGGLVLLILILVLLF
jgi:hypothetical protein